MEIVFCLIMVVVFCGLFKVLQIIVGVEDRRSIKRFKNGRIKQEFSLKASYSLAKYIVIPEYKKQTMQSELEVIGVKMTPEEYLSDSISNPIVCAILGIGVMVSGISVEVAVCILFYAGYDYFRKIGRLKRSIDHRRIKIEEEAPHLIRFFIVSLQNTKNIQHIFENYLLVAKYLKTDIERCLVDLTTIRSDENNVVYALEQFAERLNTPVMNDFVAGLLNVISGKDQESFFVILERDLEQLSINNLMRKTKKIESSVRGNFFILIFNLLFIIMSILVIFVINGLK